MTQSDSRSQFPTDLGIPVGSDGEPVFAEPWEARTFALVTSACNRGLFEWKVFQRLLIEEIRDTESSSELRPYFVNWAIAAEKLFDQLGVAPLGDVDGRVRELRPDDRTIRLPSDHV